MSEAKKIEDLLLERTEHAKMFYAQYSEKSSIQTLAERVMRYLGEPEPDKSCAHEDSPEGPELELQD